MPDSSTFVFDNFYISKLGSIQLNGQTRNQYGGVILGIEKDTFKEDALEKLPPSAFRSEIYDDINGEFNIIIRGPTQSGIAFFARRIEAMVTTASDFFNQKSGFNTFIGGSNAGGASSMMGTLKDGTFTVLKEDSTKLLHTMRAKIKYRRKPILVNSNATLTSIISAPGTSRPFEPTRVTQVNYEVPTPTSLVVHVSNAAGLFPSGLILTSNTPIITMSGGTFVNVNGAFSSIPTGLALYNETANNSFSGYSGLTEPRKGTLGFTPTSTAYNILTSGVYYANTGFNAPITPLAFPYYTQADIYANVKTTYSGTAFYVSFVAESDYDYAPDVQTDEVLIQNIANPRVVYLGRLISEMSLNTMRLKMRLRTNAVTSGTLLIDSVTIQPITDESNASVLVSKLDLLVNTTYTRSTMPSGGVYTRIDSNYAGNAGSLTSNKYTPSIKSAFYTGTLLIQSDFGYGAPTYLGNIALYRQKTDWDNYNKFVSTFTIDYSTYYYATFLATGSVMDTVSGFRYWCLTNRASGIASIGYLSDSGASYGRFSMYG